MVLGHADINDVDSNLVRACTHHLWASVVCNTSCISEGLQWLLSAISLLLWADTENVDSGVISTYSTYGQKVFHHAIYICMYIRSIHYCGLHRRATPSKVISTSPLTSRYSSQPHPDLRMSTPTYTHIHPHPLLTFWVYRLQMPVKCFNAKRNQSSLHFSTSMHIFSPCWAIWRGRQRLIEQLI